ncbi:segregation and condensation protein A [Streptomyces sp. 303MFCol5.2]|uniref:segregation and condensation protein A n=1 Tax=Streptomyces sp. 303MFCol5.2 TaxID=1172181 RepID=UPI0003A1E970|nr:segregation/condensation protein A [Streptomyces sp. 303MFCol5.2]
MTSNDVPVPGAGAAAGRRRALGRGPGTAPVPAGPEPGSAGPEPAPDPVVPDPPAVPDTAVEPDPAMPDPVEPEPVASEGAVRESVDPEPENPRTRNPQPVGSEPADLESVDPEPADPEPADPEPADPEPVVSEVVPESGVSECVGPESVPGSQEAPQEVPDGVFKVRLANFEGPFDLLLQLISKHKLDVTEVALSKVTDEFMAHIRAMGPDWDLDQTTEFLVVAATLLDLKAARLLPAAEVEDEADLALLEARDLLFARLLQYRAYKRVADIFTYRLESEARRYPRTVGLEPHHAELLPEVVISIGPEGFARLAVKAMQPRAKPQVYVDHIHAPLVSVQEQAGIVVARLRELGEASFRTLVADTEDTLTVVARFLALLELYREKAVALDQETALGELLVRWTGGDDEAQPMVTDEFDRPPEEPEKETKT